MLMMSIPGLGAGATIAAVMDWQLPEGNYEPQQMSMTVIAPRPDVERGSRSRYSAAMPGMVNQFPIKVQGGSYPFHYEITATGGTAASVGNATIGQTRTYDIGREWYRSANHLAYGIISWTPDAEDDGETYSFTVTITGQDGNSTSITFTGTVDSTRFIFVDADALSSGDGSIGSPFNSVDDFWLESASTYANSMIVYRGATAEYAAFAFSVFNADRPIVHIGYPGETPIWTGTTKDYTFDNTGCDDFWFSGIRINGSPGTSVAQCRFFEITNSCDEFDRAVFWNNYFYNFVGGSNGNDNNGWIIILRNGIKQYLTVCDNVFDTGNNVANGSYCLDIYQVQYAIEEGNVVKNWSGEHTLHNKSEVSYLSVRANDMFEGITASVGTTFGGTNNFDSSSTTADIDNQEICWNWAKQCEVELRKGLMLGAKVNITNHSVYRNTIIKNDPSNEHTIYTVRAHVEDTTDGSTDDVLKVFANASYAEERNAFAAYDQDGDRWDSPASLADDEDMAGWWTSGTFDNVHVTADASDYMDLSTGLFTGSGTTYVGSYGAFISST